MDMIDMARAVRSDEFIKFPHLFVNQLNFKIKSKIRNYVSFIYSRADGRARARASASTIQ